MTSKTHTGVPLAGSILASFQQLDEDESGFIDGAEFRRLLIELDPAVWTRERTIALLSPLDTTGDGVIDYLEFTSWIMGGHGFIEKSAKSGLLLQTRLAQAAAGLDADMDMDERAKCDKIFEIYDEDKDGFLSFSEISKLAADTGGEIERRNWRQMCRMLGCEHKKGMRKQHLYDAYVCLDAGDIDVDFKMVKERSIRISMCNRIFEAFDDDHFGRMRFEQMKRLVAMTSGGILEPRDYRAICRALHVDPSKGLTAKHLFQSYDRLGCGNILADFEIVVTKMTDQMLAEQAAVADSVPEVEIALPKYWRNQNLEASFDERVDVSSEARQQMQELLDGTFLPIRTRDRSGDFPSGLRLVKCHRVEDSKMWARYLAARESVRSKRPDGVRPIAELASGDGVVKTTKLLTEAFADRLAADVNECYLFHGSTPEGALGITSDGFKINLAGSNAGTMFGHGCYFAEAASKSDEYAADGDGLYHGIYALLLCRVVCGDMFRVLNSDIPAIEEALSSGNYDSVLGDREAAVGTYREFVVFGADVIYPEYVLLYERLFDPARQSTFVQDLASNEEFTN